MSLLTVSYCILGQSTKRDKQAYRVRAEKEYATTKKLLAKPPARDEEASMQELRRGLDKILEDQANEAPPVSLRYAHFPPREGILMDF